MADMERAEGCCAARKTERAGDTVRAMVNRLKRIEGQIRGLRGMVEADAYCPDILVQSAAAAAALAAFNRELLARHIETCVVQDIKDGREEVVDELVKVIYRLMK